tara:strand:+ start:373 stop:1053 length:681 start_codon:yes stop_codon:yes gene_type:complete
MKSKVRKLELKKIIQEYNFLLTDEKYKQEVISENKSEFLNEIHEKKVELGLIKEFEPKEESSHSEEKDSKNSKDSDSELNPENINTKESGESKEENFKNDDKSEILENQNSKQNKVKKSQKSKIIYREIVKHTHPDKVGSDDMVELYNRATDSYNNNQIIELYFMAIELDLDIELSEDDFDNIKKTIKLKRKELHNLEMSFLWLWYNAKNDEQKEKVIALFIKQSQ